MNPSSQAARFRVGPAVAVEAEPVSDANSVSRVYVASLPSGPLLCFEGTGALIWEEALRAGASSVAARVADRVGVPADEVEPDVDRFLIELVDRGLLVEVGGADLAGREWPD